MVDSTTLVLAATIVQTVVITLTLLVFIFQFRSQERSIRESSYQALMGRYNDFIMTQVSNPVLGKLLVSRIAQRNKIEREVTQEDASFFTYLLLAYGILEEAFMLYDKKWIDQEQWEQWEAWLKSMLESPEFVRLHSVMIGMFDKGFQDHVSKFVKEPGESAS